MKELFVSIRALAFFTVITGIVYPLSITFLGNGIFANRSKGSIVTHENTNIGSELIAQEFKQPKYFWARPSAAKYDGNASAGSNLSLTTSDLIKSVRERETQGAIAEMRFTSGSGLDPHISPEAALSQLTRVAEARKLKVIDLVPLVNEAIEKRQFGILGQKRVNVLLLNWTIDKRFGK